MSEALVLERVDSFYGDSHVLHGVGFTLREGALLALLGPAASAPGSAATGPRLPEEVSP